MSYIEIITFAMLCIGGNKVARTFFPKQYNMAMFDAVLYLNHVYSQIELLFTRLKRVTFDKYPIIKSYFLGAKMAYMNFKNRNVCLVKNSNIVLTVSPESMEIYNIYPFDFYITNIFDCDNDLNYNMLHFSTPTDIEYEPCNYKFISTTLEINKKRITIDLFSKTESFYNVGNRINRFVIGYLLKKQHGIDYLLLDDEYTLHIIDHNVKTIVLTEKDELIFALDDYTIKNNENNDNLMINVSFNDCKREVIRCDIKKEFEPIPSETNNTDEEIQELMNKEVHEEVEEEIQELINIGDRIEDTHHIEDTDCNHSGNVIVEPKKSPNNNSENIIDMDLYLR